MNDERFIELLNLYIDRELDGEELHAIEEAIAASPERQHIYRQYCRMERACQELLQVAPRTNKPSLANLVAAAQAQPEAGEVVPFRPVHGGATMAADGRGGARWWGPMVGLAAACVAVAFYFGPSRGGSGLLTADATDSSAIAAPVAAKTAVAASATTRLIGTDDSADTYAGGNTNGYRTVFVLDQNNARGDMPFTAGDRTADSMAWMEQMRFEPIERVEIDSLEFRKATPGEVRSLRSFAYPYPGLDDTPPISESAAFQFQR